MGAFAKISCPFRNQWKTNKTQADLLFDRIENPLMGIGHANANNHMNVPCNAGEREIESKRISSERYHSRENIGTISLPFL